VHRPSVVLLLVGDLAELLPARETELALAAAFVVVLDDTVADFKTCDVRAEGRNFATRLVTGADELAVVLIGDIRPGSGEYPNRKTLTTSV